MSALNNKQKERSLAEYTSLFDNRFIYNNPQYNQNISNNNPKPHQNNYRFQKLYDFSKIQKAKEEEVRKKVYEEREIAEVASCTFHPKINKNYNPEKVFLSPNNTNVKTQKQNINYDSKISDLLQRQSEWQDNIRKKQEIRKLNEKNKSLDKLVFNPEINKISKKFLENLRTDAKDLLKDPESYSDFVARNKNKKIIENNSNNSNNKRNKSKPLDKVNYDYTKHILARTQTPNRDVEIYNEKTENINKDNKNNNDNEQVKKSIPYNKKKVLNMNDDEIYSVVYRNNKIKMEDKIREGFKYKDKENIFNGKKIIEFDEALNTLHKVLIDIDVSDDDKEEENINIITKEEINEDKNEEENLITKKKVGNNEVNIEINDINNNDTKEESDEIKKK